MLQRQVQNVIDELVDTGAETGLQVAVYHGGDLIVDAVAGVADSATVRPMTPRTPVFSFSTGKGMTATLAHLLVNNGLIEYDTPVVDVWPEFGTYGKAAATFRHVLTHSVGVPVMPGGLARRTSWIGRVFAS
jgi:CubicO group peptidase (beta-lactamase class C family)